VARKDDDKAFDTAWQQSKQLKAFVPDQLLPWLHPVWDESSKDPC
jgi:hypothetical protein